MIKRVFGFTKVRYRGLAKNGNRVFVTAALANIFLVRYTLLGAVRPQQANGAGKPRNLDAIAPKFDLIGMNKHSRQSVSRNSPSYADVP